MGLTKKVLKRPVTTVLVVLCLIVFGLSSIFSSQLELIPEMEMPMLIVSAVYPGASPDDVDQLVISKIEDEIGTLSGVDSVTSMSSENFGMVLVQYDYPEAVFLLLRSSRPALRSSMKSTLRSCFLPVPLRKNSPDGPFRRS